MIATLNSNSKLTSIFSLDMWIDNVAGKHVDDNVKILVAIGSYDSSKIWSIEKTHVPWARIPRIQKTVANIFKLSFQQYQPRLLQWFEPGTSEHIACVFSVYFFDQTLGSKRTCWQDVLKLWSKNLPIKNFKDVSLELNLYGGFAILIIFKLSPNWALFLTHDYFWNGYRKRWMNSCKKVELK